MIPDAVRTVSYTHLDVYKRQRKYRHKTRKASFRRVFWMTVALNCAVLGLIARAGLRTVIGGA